MKRAAVVLAVLCALPIAAQERLATDFEIAQMEKQLASTRDFEAQLSGRLNLGDVRAGRGETSKARAEYVKAYDLATRERSSARRDSRLTQYASATSYQALAAAKLGRGSEAFALMEEATRYASDDAETWNLYASAMRISGRPRKAVAAARNAVAIASRDTSTLRKKLDLAVDQHALANALIDAGEIAEARALLMTVTSSLRSPAFDPLRREAAHAESFEVYSSARGDVSAYVSLLNRAQLRLARLYEDAGEIDKARAEYQHVLEGRSDDVTALGSLARLSASDAERERRYADAFDANPFSLPLVRQYQRYLDTHAVTPPPETTSGATMRRALILLSRGETRAARSLLEQLSAKFPANDTLNALQREAEAPRATALPSATPTTAELRSLLGGFDALTPEQRAQLDRMTFTSNALFATGATSAAQTVLESGTIDDVAFRFSTPTAFAGVFDTTQPLRLTYRILGVTTAGENDVLLLEPVRMEVKQ